MARRFLAPILLVGAILSTGAKHRTQNFVVEAATPEIAQQIGQYAEHYRREKAIQWLGREMPPWPQPCPLKANVTGGASGGATSFAFDRGQVLGQRMNIDGKLDRLLASVLPHEVTHTVFAHHFRQPVPRWADEGGSVLSEDDQERRHHEVLVRQMLNQRRAMPLRRLFGLKEYPPDVMVLYAQGYSVTSFLVGKSSRPAFLNFVAAGMQQGWDQAAQAHYGFGSVEELEQAWLRFVQQASSPAQPNLIASAAQPTARAQAPEQIVVRQTAPPSQPILDAPEPIIRGVAPGKEDAEAPFRPTGRSESAEAPRVRLLPPQPMPPGFPKH